MGSVQKGIARLATPVMSATVRLLLVCDVQARASLSVSENQTVTINRSLVGWLALASLLGAGAAFILETEEITLWQGVFSRVGLVLTAQAIFGG